LKNSLVFAVIPTRNRKDKTLRFLGRLYSQTYSPLKVVIVDSNSTDGTPDVVRQLYPQTTVIRASDNHYWAGATNIGVQFALTHGCDFVFTVNDDSVIQPNHISYLIDISNQYDLSILGSRIDYLSSPGLVWSLGTVKRWGCTKSLSLNYNRLEFKDLPEDIQAQDHIRVDALAGNGVLFHRSVYEKIGLYNTIFTPHYHADTELTLRASVKGIDCWVAPNVILLNDFSDEQKSLNLDTLSGLYYALFRRKSYLFVWPWLYLFFRYCPANLKVKTFFLAMSRFLGLREGSSVD
jgi:GT2 family glycosyltransferase